MYRVYQILAILVVGIFVIPSYTAAKDPCSFLANIEAQLESREGVKDTIIKICSSIFKLISEDYFDKLDPEEHGVYFTRQTGFSYTIDCSKKFPDNLEKIGLFGVGDTFKPERKKEINGETYYYGVSRPGLYVLIRKIDLRKMKDGLVYLFNRNFTAVEFCTNGVNCGGKNKQFNARNHYATIDRKSFEQNKDGSNCKNLEVKIYKGSRGYTHVMLQPEYPVSQLKYCYQHHDNGIFSIDEKTAKQNFKKLPITGQYMMLSSKSLTDKVPFIFTRKDCQNKSIIKKKTRMSLGGSIGAGAAIKVVKLGIDGKASIELDISDEEIFEKDKQYLYQNYTAIDNSHPFVNNARRVLNDIVISQVCEDGVSIPTRLNEVKINIFPEENKIISVNARSLHEQAQQFFRSTGVWLDASSTSRKNGKTWIIASLEQQRQWKDFIFNRIYRDLSGVFPSQQMSREVKLDYADYFTTLLMATVFEYVTKDQLSSLDITDRF